MLSDSVEQKVQSNSSAINKSLNLEKLFLCGNMIAHPIVMFRTIGEYRDFKATHQDYDLWLILIKKGVKFAVIEKPLLYYRVREDSITQTNRGRENAYDLYAKYLYKNEINGKKGTF